MTSAERYVAAAYLVVLVVLLVYLLIITLKIARLEREVTDLAERALARTKESEAREEVAVG
jgi:hypothetical protein